MIPSAFKPSWKSSLKVKKGKVKLSLSWIKRQVKKMSGGVELELQVYLIWTLGWDGLSASRPGRFNRRKRAPGTHWIRGWVDPRTSVHTALKRQIPRTFRQSNPNPSAAHSLVTMTCLYFLSVLNTKFEPKKVRHKKVGTQPKKQRYQI